MNRAWLCYPQSDDEDTTVTIVFVKPWNEWRYSKIVQIVDSEITE